MKDQPINPGILKTVEFLQSKHFITIDSGDGETHDFECDIHIPYVHMRVNDTDAIREADRLFRILREEQIVVNDGDIQLTYDPCTEIAILSLFNIKII